MTDPQVPDPDQVQHGGHEQAPMPNEVREYHGSGPDPTADHGDVSVLVTGRWGGNQAPSVEGATVHASVPGSASGSDPAELKIGGDDDDHPRAQGHEPPHPAAPGHDQLMDSIHDQTYGHGTFVAPVLQYAAPDHGHADNAPVDTADEEDATATPDAAAEPDEEE